MKLLRSCLAAAAGIAMAACSGNGIRGTYLSHAQGELSVSRDTLRIEAARDGYRAIRSTAFRRIDGGGMGPWEHRRERWRLVESENGRYVQSPGGKTLRFYPERGELLLGGRVYKKIEH